jgi:thymidine phosphorylase
VCLRKRGDAVAYGEPLAEIHARSEDAADAVEADVRAAYVVGPDRRPARSVLIEVVD